MHVVLVPEFGKLIGYGHLSRLIAIAEELVTRNYTYCFHILDAKDSVANLMMNSSNLSFNCNCEVQPNFLVIDSYNANILLPEINVADGVRFIQVVDDVNEPFFADGYVEASPINVWTPSNIDAPILQFKMSPILRKQFENMGLRSKSEFASNSKVLITLGSSLLIINILKLVVSAIRKSKFSAHNIYVSTNSNRNPMLKSVMAELKVKSIDNLNGALEISNGFDLVISACGVTAWELLFTNTPCFFIGTVKNQQKQLDYFIINGLADGLMFSESSQFVENTAHKLNTYSNNFGASNIDNGRKKVVDWLENLNQLF